MLIALSGKKQAGKTSIANFLAGEYLRQKGQITGYVLDKETSTISLSNEPEECGVNIYSFANSLKMMCVNFFGLEPNQVFGTDADKNTLTHIKWENIPLYTPQDLKNTQINELPYFDKTGYMTAREFMQILGTDVMRRIYEPIWVNSLLSQIKEENFDLAIIADCRYPNEVEALKDHFIIRLTRAPFKDSHSGENALDNYSFENVLDNANMEYDEQNYHVYQMVKDKLGWE